MSTQFSRLHLSSQIDATMADAGFLQATAKSLGVIFASEIGDKTFFIAALMAMRHPRTLVRIPARDRPRYASVQGDTSCSCAKPFDRGATCQSVGRLSGSDS